jgi:endogenous inhibitor of DNA gyrase (YacG/DUF329 family)
VSADPKRVTMNCPSCGKVHVVQLHEDRTGPYPKRYYLCAATENRVDLTELREA